MLKRIRQNRVTKSLQSAEILNSIQEKKLGKSIEQYQKEYRTTIKKFTEQQAALLALHERRENCRKGSFLVTDSKNKDQNGNQQSSVVLPKIVTTNDHTDRDLRRVRLTSDKETIEEKLNKWNEACDALKVTPRKCRSQSLTYDQGAYLESKMPLVDTGLALILKSGSLVDLRGTKLLKDLDVKDVKIERRIQTTVDDFHPSKMASRVTKARAQGRRATFSGSSLHIVTEEE